MVGKMCAFPGCTLCAEEGKKYCQAHEASTAKREGNASLFKGGARKASRAWQRLYRTARWKKMRSAFLEEHPWCAYCGAPATEADHIRAHRGDLHLFYNVGNLQALCKSCHSAKTLAENANFNTRRRSK